MKVDRRAALLGALGLGAAAATATAQEQAPPAQSTPAPSPTLEQRITARAAENRHRMSYETGRFSGPAWDMLVAEGEAAQFFCLGEEHGIAENPKLAAQLFGALTPAGYSKVCVEVSPPIAAELDRAARGGMDGLRTLFANPRAGAAFFGMREEAEWLASARAFAPGREQAVWGLDYEVGGCGHMIDQLGAKRKPAAAQAPFAALAASERELFAQFQSTRSPQFIFSFAGDPALVRAVREAWPSPDAESAWMLETLEETLTINRLWVSGQAWQSNERRARFNRNNFRRYWNAERRKPKVMFKFGAGHMVRGVSHTQVLDIGTQVSELAEANGGKSFHLLVLPGAASQVAQFNPSTWTYNPADSSSQSDSAFAPLMAAAYADAITLIDLRPIRSLVFGARHRALDADLVRNIHGFDALLVLTGSTPSANL
jgi:hypothetical protein